LREHLKKNKLDFEEITNIAIQIAKGLRRMHSLNFVHRDIKPANILIMKNGNVKIADFGISKQIEFLAGTLSGTPIYMAPEMYDSTPGVQTFACDIYSFSLVLWEMIHHVVPFQNLTPLEIIKIKTNNKMPVINCECPNIIKEVIENCWKLKKEERPKIDDIIDILQSLSLKFKNDILN